MAKLNVMTYAVVEQEVDLAPYSDGYGIDVNKLTIVENAPSPQGGTMSVRYGNIPVTMDYVAYCDGTDSGEIELDIATHDDGTRMYESALEAYLMGLDPDGDDDYFDVGYMTEVVKSIIIDCIG